MVNKLDVGKALEKLRGGNEETTRIARLDEKNRELEEEIQRLSQETLRLRRDNVARPIKKQ